MVTPSIIVVMRVDVNAIFEEGIIVSVEMSLWLVDTILTKVEVLTGTFDVLVMVNSILDVVGIANVVEGTSINEIVDSLTMLLL